MTPKIEHIISEYKRLTGLPEPKQSKLAKFILSDLVEVGHENIISDAIVNFLKSHNTPSNFYDASRKIVNRGVFQYLYLHFLVKRDQPVLNSLREIHIYMNSFSANATLQNRQDKSSIIMVLENLGIATWASISLTSATDPLGLYLLEGSLTHCSIDLNTMYDFLRSLAKINPERKIYRLWGRHIVDKLKADQAMRASVLQDFTVFYSDLILQELFPAFLRGSVNDDPTIFVVQLQKLVDKASDENLANTLYALATACPDNKLSISLLKQTMDDNRVKSRLTAAAYLQILNLLNLTTPAITSYVLERTLLADLNELGFITDYLNQNLASANENWFKSILAKVVVMPQVELTENLNHLLTMLMDDHRDIVYKALDLRFTAIGAQSFLSNIWQELPDQDPALFSEWLTTWFGRDQKSVHLGMLQLTSNSNITHGRFILSQTGLAPLTETDKLFIAYKLAGYVYERRALQSLFFSLIDSMKEYEKVFNDQLYIIMNDYVVYNYRSIFDMIRIKLTEVVLPGHIIEFYERIFKTYEQYFQALDEVNNSIELRPDTTLSEHVHYFWNHKMTSDLKEKRKTGLASLFKSTTINSHRWAIRGRGDIQLKPQTMGTFRTEFEYPAGEVLNPVQSERIRSTFQKVTKNEITLN